LDVSINFLDKKLTFRIFFYFFFKIKLFIYAKRIIKSALLTSSKNLDLNIYSKKTRSLKERVFLIFFEKQ